MKKKTTQRRKSNEIGRKKKSHTQIAHKKVYNLERRNGRERERERETTKKKKKSCLLM